MYFLEIGKDSLVYKLNQVCYICAVKITKTEKLYITYIHIMHTMHKLTLKMNPYLPAESAIILMSRRPSDIRSSIQTYTQLIHMY